MHTDRFPLDEARRYIMQAFMKVNKYRKANLALLDLEYTDLMGFDFIKAQMYDKDSKLKFSVMLNEFIFKGHEYAMTKLDTEAKIIGKNLSDRDIIILRCAYTICKDWAVGIEIENAKVK